VSATDDPKPGSTLRRLDPLDPPMVPFILGGTAVWAVLGLTLLLAHDWVQRHGHQSWLGICLAGFLLGLLGTAMMLRHDARRSR